LEPFSIVTGAALYVGAQIARKPTDEFASVVWKCIKDSLRKTFGREPMPADMTTSNMTKLIGQSPELTHNLEGVFDRSSALRRAQMAQKALRGARILWIDDRPENNAWERQLFGAFGVRCTPVETTRSAVASLRVESVDLVISDNARGSNSQAGVEALSDIRAIKPNVPVVFYVGTCSSYIPPPGSQGICDEPNELLHLVLDQLERIRV